MRSCDKHSYPNLKYDIITNAVLFTEDITDRFPSFMDKLRSVRVSMDAITEDTYKVVRLGGDWKKLMTNLIFISNLKKTKKIDHFSISMVVQTANFEEMVDFLKFGRSIGCDIVIYEFIMNWTIEQDRYNKMAVHEPSHPQHHTFRNKVRELESTSREVETTGTLVSFPLVYEFGAPYN